MIKQMILCVNVRTKHRLLWERKFKDTWWMVCCIETAQGEASKSRQTCTTEVLIPTKRVSEVKTSKPNIRLGRKVNFQKPVWEWESNRKKAKEGRVQEGRIEKGRVGGEGGEREIETWREMEKGKGREEGTVWELHKCQSKRNINRVTKMSGRGDERGEWATGEMGVRSELPHVGLSTLENLSLENLPSPFPIHWNHTHRVERLSTTRSSDTSCLTTLFLLIILVKRLAFLGLNTF